MAAREATPPSAAPVDGRRRLRDIAAKAGIQTAGEDIDVLTGRPQGPPTPPPAPVQGEAAVEALADVLNGDLGWDWHAVPAEFVPSGASLVRDLALLVAAALDRGAIPGYGPTGA